MEVDDSAASRALADLADSALYQQTRAVDHGIVSGNPLLRLTSGAKVVTVTGSGKRVLEDAARLHYYGENTE